MISETPQLAIYLAPYISAAKNELTNYVNSLIETYYLPANWTILQNKYAAGLLSIEQALSTAMVTKALENAIEDIDSVELYIVSLNITWLDLHGMWFFKFMFNNPAFQSHPQLLGR